MVEVRQVCKNNGVILQGLVLQRKGSNVVPTIYLEPFWKNYESGATMTEIIDSILSLYERECPSGEMDLSFFQDFDRVKEKIVYRLVNAKWNEELLKSIPHIRFLDLAICFSCSFCEKTLGIGEVLVYNNHVDAWGTSVEELLELARRNTCLLYGTELMDMEDLLEEFAGAQAPDLPLEERGAERIPLKILSNRRRVYGAAAMLYPDLLRKVAEEMDCNLFILPSSVHEVLLMPDRGHPDPRLLREMVCEVNETQVAAEEVLSEDVYYFDRRRNELRIA